MNRILVPTDFSTSASNATQIAMDLAQKLNAQIHFLHFTSIPVDWVNLSGQEKMYPDVTKRIKEYQRKLDELVKACSKLGIKASSYIGYNESYQNIIDHLKIHDIDLIVMGSKGTSGIKELILGSNAQKMVRLSTVPLLVVKPETTFLKVNSLTVVSDFVQENKDSNHLQAFKKLVELATSLELSIHLLYVNTPGGFITSKTINQRALSYMESTISEEGLVVINANNLEEGISDFLEEHPNTIIGMITHGETGINRMIRGSQVESVVNHVTSPVISIKIESTF